MKMSGGVLCGGGSRGNVVPRFFSHRTSSLRISSSSSNSEHVSFVKDVAVIQPPQHLSQLLSILKTRGAVTALLRWPTAPPKLEMPVVEVRKHGVWLLAKTVDQYIHRILVEEDAKDSQERNEELFHASADAGEKLYRKGDFAESGISNLDVYLLKKVGIFPDILERKVRRHFDEGDQVSALVTGEFYTKKEHFPGFARPFVFNAEIMLRVGRKVEAKDAARGALKSPWWTLGCMYREVANIAQWDDEQIEYIKEKVTEEGRQEDLKKGKAPEQVVLDEAAFLLDLASIEGNWDDYVEQIAKCYEEGGLNDIAKFILYQ
ncbi:hypothetical protein TSUD_339370 [Trifolium subterraneum]|nr:hypothetical protein TSUD_339370 [Trifolium subterraneum]